MESFLRNAEHILETAVTAGGPAGADYVICVSREGSIRLLSETVGWSLPALATELGADALYQVRRRGTTVRVEGWSYGRNCVLTRDSSNEWWSRPTTGSAYATRPWPQITSGSQNDFSPQVRNS